MSNFSESNKKAGNEKVPQKSPSTPQLLAPIDSTVHRQPVDSSLATEFEKESKPAGAAVAAAAAAAAAEEEASSS